MISSISSSFSRSDSMTPIEYEIEALSSIYMANLEKISSYPYHEINIFLTPHPLASIHGKDPICWAKLYIKYNDGYPGMPPELEIVDKYNINEEELNLLNEEIDEIVMSKSAENSVMIFDVCRCVEKFLDVKSKAFSPPKGSRKLSSVPKNISPLGEPKKVRKLSEETNSKLSEKFSNIDKENIKFMRKFLKDEDDLNSKQDTALLKNISYFEKGLELDQKVSIGSRLYTDFEIIEKIGQGGGGSVYKVKHNIDKQLYAIKKIKLYTGKNPSKILQEVMWLSQLQHPNIVRYYQAWYEDYDVLKEENNDEDEYEEYSDEEIDESNENNNLSQNVSNSIMYNNTSKNSYSSDKYDYNLLVFEDPNTNNLKNNIWEIEDDKSYHESLKKEKASKTKYLIIQMEYCEGQTLREAIDKKILLEDKIKWKIIIQIIDSLFYIHRKRLIHRDIKPPNVFLDKNYNVKLGDFGLATVSKPKTALENISSNKEFLKLSQFNNKIGGDLLSCGIGTMYYCSPEQEKNNKYDSKTDLFSLGIIIFEMFYSFNSLMERDIILRNIKEEHKFPPKFSACPADAIDIVKKLTVRNPSSRPSAKELLDSNLVSRNYNEKTVLDNLNKMIEENKPFSLKLINAIMNNLLVNNKKVTNSEYNMLNSDFDNNNTIYDDQLINNYNYSLDNYFSKLNSFGQINLKSSNFIFTIYNKICKKIKKIFKKVNADYIRFSEIEAYTDKVPVYDSVLNSLIMINNLDNYTNKIKLKNNNDITLNPEILSDSLMITTTGEVVRTSKNIFIQLSRFIKVHYGYSSRSIYPLKFFTDVVSSEVNLTGDRMQETNEIDFCLIWNGSNFNSNQINKIQGDDDEVFEKNCLEVLFDTITVLELSNNVHISINSSVIIDYFFYKLGILEDYKYKTIQLLGNILNPIKKSENKKYTIKELLKIINLNQWEKKFDQSLPISKDKFKELLTVLDRHGDIETIKNRYEKNYDQLSDEIGKIYNKFEYFWRRYINLRDKIQIDFSLMPTGLTCYSGFFYQVTYSANSGNNEDNDYENDVITEGGRIDNHLNNISNTNPLKLRGFTLRYFTENIFKIKIQKLKEKDYSQFKIDLLVINNVDCRMDYKNIIINYMNDIKNVAKEEKLSCEFIYKNQVTLEFSEFFMVYRMKLLIIIKYDENLKKVIFEYKMADKKLKDNYNMKEVTNTLKKTFSKQN